MRQEERMAVQHPPKVNTLIDAACESDDLLIFAKALFDGENTGEQQRSVD
jgi:hypothetical protein